MTYADITFPAETAFGSHRAHLKFTALQPVIYSALRVPSATLANEIIPRFALALGFRQRSLLCIHKPTKYVSRRLQYSLQAELRSLLPGCNLALFSTTYLRPKI